MFAIYKVLNFFFFKIKNTLSKPPDLRHLKYPENPPELLKFGLNEHFSRFEAMKPS